MKITKNYLKQIILEEILKEFNAPPKIKSISKRVLEDKSIIFIYLLDGEEKTYQDFNISSLIEKEGALTVPSLQEYKRKFWHSILNISSNPQKFKDLQKSYINLFGSNFDRAFELAKNKSFDEYEKNISEDIFKEIIEEYKYRNVANFLVHYKTLGVNEHSGEVVDSRSHPMYPAMMEFIYNNVPDLQDAIPKNSYGKNLRLDKIKQYFIDTEEPFKYNPRKFLPLSLIFTNILTDTLNKSYSNGSALFVNEDFQKKAKSVLNISSKPKQKTKILDPVADLQKFIKSQLD